MKAALAMDRKLMRKVATTVKPETIPAWQRRLERKEQDYSRRHRRKPGRPRTPEDVEALYIALHDPERSKAAEGRDYEP